MDGVCLHVSLQSSSSGSVPYLGTYLTVLTMLDTALLDTVEVHDVARGTRVPVLDRDNC